MPARRGNQRNSSRATKPRASRKNVPAKTLGGQMTVAEIRAKIGDAKKEVLIRINDSDLHGTLKEITTRLNEVAKTNGLKGEWEVGKRIARVGGRYGHSETRLHLIGFRPYTDEEIQKEGPRLVRKVEADEKRAAAKRQKEIREFNARARRLGQPTIPEA